MFLGEPVEGVGPMVEGGVEEGGEEWEVAERKEGHFSGREGKELGVDLGRGAEGLRGDEWSRFLFVEKVE